MSTPAGPVGTVGTSVAAGGDTVADRVRAAVLALPGVSDLHPGSFGEVATYAAGRRIVGVRVRPARAEVHVVAAWSAPVLETADVVRRTVEPITGTPVDVYVDDVAAPPETAASSSAPPVTPSSPPSSRRTS